MLDARTLDEIPEHWLRHGSYWREAAFVWKRWVAPEGPEGESGQAHEHCPFCWACICDGRDRDPYCKPGPVEGGHYRHAYYAERPDGSHVWVCRTCFKRVRAQFEWHGVHFSG